MNFIWIATTSILGLVMFLFVRDHFIWSIPYVVIHLSIIAFLKFRGVLDLRLPLFVIPFLFLTLQLTYSIYVFATLDSLGLKEDAHTKEFKMNLIRLGLLVVEYPLLLEFFKKPKYNRY